MTEASSPDAPKLIGACSRKSYSGPAGADGRLPRLRVLLALLDRRGGAVAEVGVLEALEQPLDVGRRGHRRTHLVAGHDRDVVLGEHVRGVRHGDQQRALAGERDRDRLVALGRRRGDELGGIGVDAVEPEVDVVEPEALRHRARELLVPQRAVLDEDALGERALVLRLRERDVHRPLVDEPEVDDDVAQHAAGPASP